MSEVGVVLDVDGVLVRGSKVIPQATAALRLLQEAGIPTLFVTNGGNMTEKDKATKLSSQLQFVINENQVVLSHTPWKGLVPTYRNKRVLVIGCSDSIKVARAYGFENVVTPECFHKKNPDIYPVKPGERREQSTAVGSEDEDSVHAAFIFSDSADWGLHMQVLTDVLLDNNHEFCNSSITVYACNADVVYTGTHHLPRFTQGAFVHSFQALFQKYTNHDAPIEFCGKPFQVQYDYSEKLFGENAQALGVAQPTKFYAVGDNPRSDIRGANAAGSHWTSVLVKTGVFKGDIYENDEADPADWVVDNVLNAVTRIIAEVDHGANTSMGGKLPDCSQQRKRSKREEH